MTRHAAMAVAVAGPSGRALYEQATSAFVRNMPLETLCIIAGALEDGKHRGHPRLAEQYLLLKITALFTVYSPNDKARLDARIRQWRRQSSGSARRRRNQGGRDVSMASSMSEHASDTHEDASSLSQSTSSISADEQLPFDVQSMLDLPPAQFLARMWAMCLRYGLDNAVVPSVQSAMPSETVDAIVSSPDTVASALQLPSSICEALVAGALKLDAAIAQSSNSGAIRSRKDVQAETPQQPGLQAAQAMCEWTLSAYASIVMEELSVKERRHLQMQYGKVMRLYALELLGRRLGEWEYAREVVRCSQVLAQQHELAQEMQEREKLLYDIQEAEKSVPQKDERRQAAKEHAQRLVEEQVARRTSAAQATSPSSHLVPSDDGPRRSLSRRSSTSSSASTVREGPGAGTGSQTSTPPSSTSPREPTSSDTVKGKRPMAAQDRGRDDVADASSPKSVRAPPGADKPATPVARRQQHGAVTTLSLESIRQSLLRWLRTLGPVPAVLCTAIALLLMLRRLLGGRAPTANSHVAAPPSAAQLAARRRQAMAQNSGIASLLWQKISDTLRMGTQVTYL